MRFGPLPLRYQCVVSSYPSDSAQEPPGSQALTQGAHFAMAMSSASVSLSAAPNLPNSSPTFSLSSPPPSRESWALTACQFEACDGSAGAMDCSVEQSVPLRHLQPASAESMDGLGLSCRLLLLLALVLRQWLLKNLQDLFVGDLLIRLELGQVPGRRTTKLRNTILGDCCR